MKPYVFMLITTIFLLSCQSSRLSTKVQFFEQDEAINLYAFIGKKISLNQVDLHNDTIGVRIDSLSGKTEYTIRTFMDYAFQATYEVEENIFNKLPLDRLQFDVYDHYGRPGFEQFEYVLLYVSLDEEDGHYYHQKYQFDPVKQHRGGHWIGKNGKTLEELFNKKREGVLTARGIFKKTE